MDGMLDKVELMVTELERLEGLIPKVEDWHAGRVLYQAGLLLM